MARLPHSNMDSCDKFPLQRENAKTGGVAALIYPSIDGTGELRKRATRPLQSASLINKELPVINTYGPPPMAHRIRIPRPYTPSFATDIRETFDRERVRLERENFARVARAQRDERAYREAVEDGLF